MDSNSAEKKRRRNELTTGEIAKILRITTSQVGYLRQQEKGPPYREATWVGGKVFLYSIEGLKGWIEQQVDIAEGVRIARILRLEKVTKT